ncbi:MAG: methyltransferase [Myxococcaceae bacterium]|nr:methyltransferase [Myxococcaceae bacterium]
MKVGHGISAANAGWSFSGSVPETFVDHIRHSVPLYEEGHDLICQLSDFFCGHESVCYEIGVSTGELIKKLALHHAAKPKVRWVGLDVEEAMAKKAREHCADVPNIQIVHEDIRLYPYEQSDLFVSYYTLQFVPPRDRQALLDRIYESLHWGGAFILFEKVRGPDARFQDILSSLYNDFKTRNGLSADEILSKTRSLKGVLEPFSTEGNLGLLRRAGFVDIMAVQKYLCFEGFLAIK